MPSLKLPGLICLLILSSCLSPNQKLIKKLGARKGLFAKITTEKGIIIAKLEFEKTPVTVANFAGLAQGIIPNDVKKAGEPYYDGLKFHRVIRDQLVIGGCPKGDGTGHPGYYFKDEFHPELTHNKAGVLSMENHGPTTNGSRFNITLRESPEMDNKNPAFGLVISGMETLHKMQQGEVIVKVEIIRLGRRAKKFNPLDIFKKNGF